MKYVIISFLCLLLTACNTTVPSTKEEAVKSVLDQLNKRYHESFVVEDEIEKEEGISSEWWGYAHVKDNPEKRCYFCLKGNNLKENYSINNHAKNITSIIEREMETSGLDGKIEVGYSILGKRLNDLDSDEKILYSSDCEIFYTKNVAYSGHPEDYVSLVRQWLSYLYSCKHKWYFEMKDESKNLKIFLLDPSNYGYSNESDWTDEKIIEEINYYLRFKS